MTLFVTQIVAQWAIRWAGRCGYMQASKALGKNHQL